MKVYAFFLPQFHEIPENNTWWGEGFTEWINVKKGKPLFTGHIQPKVPLNDYYYNLLDIDTVKWQTKLMDAYSVDGLIYYHYYFKGKLLLEKPAENLLKHKEIKQNFFFCWANHSWIKSWEGKKDILIEQTYGMKDDWEKHFQYLLQFFLDPRYEKNNNMPLLMTFRSDFKERHDLFKYFDKRCKDYGFDGLYLIETFHGTQGMIGYAKACLCKTRVTKQIYIRQPSEAQRFCEKKGYFNQNNVKVYDGNDLYEHMIKYIPFETNAIQGLFFEWDNTPRHGERGYVITPPSKQRFFDAIRKLKKNNYVFVNAWNEWAEGMVLEPTEQDGYKYLEWIHEWRSSRNI